MPNRTAEIPDAAGVSHWYMLRDGLAFPTSGQVTPDSLQRDWVEITRTRHLLGTPVLVGAGPITLNNTIQKVNGMAAANALVSQHPTERFYAVVSGIMNNDETPPVPAKGLYFYDPDNQTLSIITYLPA